MKHNIEFGDGDRLTKFLGMQNETIHFKRTFVESVRNGDEQTEEMQENIDKYFKYKKEIIKKSFKNLKVVKPDLISLKNHFYNKLETILTAESIDKSLRDLRKKLNEMYD